MSEFAASSATQVFANILKLYHKMKPLTLRHFIKQRDIFVISKGVCITDLTALTHCRPENYKVCFATHNLPMRAAIFNHVIRYVVKCKVVVATSG